MKTGKSYFGVFAGIFGFFAIWLTVAVVGAWFILNAVAGQINATATLFDNGWQVLLFVLDVVCVVAMLACIVLAIVKRIKAPKVKVGFVRGVLNCIFCRGLWSFLTAFVAVVLAILVVGTPIAESYKTIINDYLHLENYNKIELGDAETLDPEASQYYKSAFLDDVDARREASKQTNYQTAVEGTVMLWNNNDTLPLAKNTKLNLFGLGWYTYYYAQGGGSGLVSSAPRDNFWKACSACSLTINDPLWYAMVDARDAHNAGRMGQGDVVAEAPWSEIEDDANQNVNGGTALVVIRRFLGETTDTLLNTVSSKMVDSGYYLDLSVDEASVLEGLKGLKESGKLDSIVVVINSSNALQFKTLTQEKYGVDACVWVGQGGAMSFYQIASAISGRGDYVMSGRLPDTYFMDNDAAPASVNQGDCQFTDCTGITATTGKDVAWTGVGTTGVKYVVYQEGIYVGYKYTETRYEDIVLGNGNASSTAGVVNSSGNWDYKSEVAFPFGYGLDYTEYEYSNYSVTKNADGDYDVSVTIKNVGDDRGKAVAQIYLQKPYTDYDKQYGIEKAAVELVGFAKTDILQPNDSQTLSITVDAEEFKTYDAYNKKTYILEKGDYYLAFGANSHDAINNILAAKGKTTADGMTENGNEAFTYKETILNDDYTKYSKSTATGYPITNQMDNADINLYEGTQDQKITYLSRNNWSGTYPSRVQLTAKGKTKLVQDINSNGYEVTADSADEMPIFGEVTSSLGKLSLIQLKDLPYDHALWEDLLNQMTKEEHQELASGGLHNLGGVESISAPGCESKDGPCGIWVQGGDNVAFPCGAIVAATFNIELIEKLGDAFGEEVFASGCGQVYGPAANIHRTAEGGRNWEYYSEDAFLSGKTLSYEIQGMQKCGVIVTAKHFALNEQETNRYGICVFANEQTARECYFKAFEYAVTEGKANGIMSSFNRIGTTWSGAHYGVMKEILRNEWGFIGLNETDCCANGAELHMRSDNAKARGVLAGQNVWMDSQRTDAFLATYENNATVMKALRESSHQILYTQLHSMLMNGMTTTTRIVEARNWWQDALTMASSITFYVLGGCLLMTAYSFIWHIKDSKKEEEGADGE